MSIEETIREIKAQFRLYMNGVASASMRQKGLAYRLNFGIEWPRLREMASNYVPNTSLALALWNENVRECKIMAILLMPPGEFDAAMADLWAEQMPNAELAGWCAMLLFSALPFAPYKAMQWMASEQDMVQLAGILTASHLKRKGYVYGERNQMEIRDQLDVLQHSECYAVAHAACLLLQDD